MRYVMRHRLQVAAYLFVVLMSAFGIWLVEHRAFEGRQQLCRVAKEVGIESTEALIEIATQNTEDPPDPEVIEALRDEEERRMTEIVRREGGSACRDI